MRGQQLSRDKMEGLEDEVESLAQELEEKKREEAKRLKKVATIQNEIQVFRAGGGFSLKLQFLAFCN